MHSLLLGPALLLAALPSQDDSALEPEELRCVVILSIDMTFWERWDYSSEPGPFLPGARRVVHGQHFAPHVLVSHPGIDDAGMARLRQDLRILRPDGTVYFEETDFDAHTGPFQAGNLLRTQSRLAVSLEPEDPFGIYRVEVTLRDLVAGSTGTSSSAIELVEYEEGAGFENLKELESWLTRYRSEPDPSRIVPAILAAGGGGWENERGMLHGALRDLVDGNTWLLPELVAHLEGADEATRHWLLWIASRQTELPIDLAARLEGTDLELWNRLSAAHDPLVDPVQGREDINELWGMYWPRRSIVPIIRLCSLLSPLETEAVADIRLPSPEVPDGVPLWMVVVDVATRVLLRGMDWDPLVRDYCDAVLLSEGTPPGLQRQLRTLLEAVPSKR